MSGSVLVIRNEHLEQVRAMAGESLEQAALLLVGHADVDPMRLLVREVHPLDPRFMSIQTPTRITIASDAFLRPLRRAEELHAGVLLLHTHPANAPYRSDLDEDEDAALGPVVDARTGSSLYGSGVLGLRDGNLTFTGRHRRGDAWERIDRLWSIGDRFRLISAADSPSPAPPASMFDRQVLAFGPAFQQLLGHLTVGVIGGGGTGSPTAEQLTRLGAGRLLLFDDQAVTDTNLTRIHEVVADDVDRLKVEALRDRLSVVGTGTVVEAVPKRISDLESALRLRECDLIFGCTDDNTGRAILSRLAYRFLVPVIDVSFVIGRPQPGAEIDHLSARVTTLVPGQPCLFCRGYVNLDRMAEEGLDDEERAELEAEGYVQGLPVADPAVVAFTTLAASLGVTEMIERIVGYDQPPPGEIFFYLHNREVRRMGGTSGEHWCGDTDVWGVGETEPFLDRTW